jgi:hypothetical protein
MALMPPIVKVCAVCRKLTRGRYALVADFMNKEAALFVCSILCAEKFDLESSNNGSHDGWWIMAVN